MGSTWKSAILYSLARIGVFIFFLGGFLALNAVTLRLAWYWPLVAAGLVSAIVSYYLLSGPRVEMAEGIERAVERRHERAASERLAGEAEEDAEAEARASRD